jgi:glycosyltransferase involved in cell wall biosynthesis
VSLQKAKDTTVIIAAYNEEQNIKAVIDDIQNQRLGCDIIVIDDCSTDKTHELAVNKGVKVIKHKYNKGYGASLKTGIRNAKTKYVLFFDGDGQHDASYIINLLNKTDEYDLVVGRRTRESRQSMLRKPGKKLIRFVANYLVGSKIPDLNSGLRVAQTETIKKYLHMLSNRFSFTTTMTLTYMKENLDIGYTSIITRARKGKSTVRYFRDGLGSFVLVARIIMLFDPLKVFVPLSLALVAGGTVRFLHGIFWNVDNSITSILGILGGLVIFFFGLLADQLAHIRRELRENKDSATF